MPRLVLKLLTLLPIVLVVVFTIFILALNIKTNNPTNPWKLTKSTEASGPFESSNTTSRFALVEAIALNKRLHFDIEQARFAVPDAVAANGRFFSSFTPGISFFAVPFYFLGRQLVGSPELGVFLSTILLAVLNGFLIYRIALHLSGNKLASLLSAGTFLFATNAAAYAGTLTQHHGSTAVILLALLCALGSTSWWRNVAFGVLCGIGFLFDFPNLFMLFPIGLYVVAKHFSFSEASQKVVISVKLTFILIVVGLLPLLGVFAWYNAQTVGTPSQFAQFSVRTNIFDSEEKKAEDLERSKEADQSHSNLPFNTRLQLQGTYILLLSNERSWLWYSPVLLLGLIGVVVLYKKNPGTAVLLLSIVAIDIVMYSMFGDPWGGWSFGPRYLIPGAAIMAVALSLALAKFRKNVLFLVLYMAFFIYSCAITMAGSLTSNAIPPKQESVTLINYVPYTYEYNFRYLENDHSNSLLYQAWFQPWLKPYTFYYLVVGSIVIGISALVVLNALNGKIKKS